MPIPVMHPELVNRLVDRYKLGKTKMFSPEFFSTLLLHYENEDDISLLFPLAKTNRVLRTSAKRFVDVVTGLRAKQTTCSWARNVRVC